MSLKSEKTAAVKKYTTDLLKRKDMTAATSKIQNVFLRDTVNGKLYKYCGVSEFTVMNILHNTLHCSTPSSFNDPFDIYPGWFLPYAMIFLKENLLLMEIIENTIEVLSNIKQIEDVPQKQQKIVQYCVNEESIREWYAQISNNQPFHQKDASMWKTTIMKALIITATPAEKQQGQYSVPWLRQNLAQILEQKLDKPKYLHLESLRQAAQMLDATWSGDDIEALLFLGNNLLEPKDIKPFQRYVSKVDSYIQKLRNHVWIGCLTTTYKHRLMWSHYANSHKGICIEYDFTTFNFADHDVIPLPVYYTKTRPQLPKSLRSWPKPNELQTLTLHDCLQKDFDWQYENEWRIVVHSKQNQDYPMPPISCIYLGACISDAHKEIICNLAKQQGIPVKQMKMDREIYELHAYPV